MKARIINAWRKLFPHPAAIARREESRRQKLAHSKRAAKDRARFLLVAEAIKRERGHG